MANIKVLDKQIINLISAGEVIERPASVLKELLENSVDAHASEIDVKIYQKDIDKIIVSDNGIGMTKDEILLSTYNHATSKINSKDDLDNIKSLGFRGEALASICAVSKTKITSKTKDGRAFELEFEGSQNISQKEVAANIGTTVEVSNLFFNTPARLKYLSSMSTERKNLIDIFLVIALSNSKIKFRLYIDDQLIKETYGIDNDIDLISSLFGDNYIDDLKILNEEIHGIKFKIYLFSTKLSRSNKNDIFIFINNRFVKNYLLKNAVIKGYQPYLMVRKYPICIVKIEMDNKSLDVNIHPQKLEVKLYNEYAVKAYLEGLIRNNLVNQNKNIKTLQNENIEYDIDTIFSDNIDLVNVSKYENIEDNIKPNIDFQYDYIGQFYGTYLLFQNRDGLYIIDQHAASERIRYENFKKTMNTNYYNTPLISISLNLSQVEKDIIIKNMDKLNNIGFIFDDNLNIIKYPNYLKENEIDISIKSYLEEDNDFIFDNWLKSVSCKGAIKANQYLTRAEASKLLYDLLNVDNYKYCIHGRPSIIKYSISDIEKIFKRIV